jgi:hypothetical protein
MSNETLEDAGAIAAGLCEHLEANEQAMFIAGFQACAKWQAAQGKSKYSEEDMIAFMQFSVSNQELENTSSVSRDTAKYYLEQFKKQKS